MRLMSFALTTPQILARTKTVTRRLGWATARVGDVVQPVEKGQGLKKGEKVVRVGCPIRFTVVDSEPLFQMAMFHGVEECAREGFPGLTPAEFIAMFCLHNGCLPRSLVTRIAFEYTEPA